MRGYLQRVGIKVGSQGRRIYYALNTLESFKEIRDERRAYDKAIRAKRKARKSKPPAPANVVNVAAPTTTAYAPKPKVRSSYGYKIYETIDALADSPDNKHRPWVKSSDVYAYLPTVLEPGESMPSKNRFRDSLLSSAMAHGYITYTKDRSLVRLATWDEYQQRIAHREAYPSSIKKKTEASRPRRKTSPVVKAAPASPVPSAQPQPVVAEEPAAKQLSPLAAAGIGFVAGLVGVGSALSFALWLLQ